MVPELIPVLGSQVTCRAGYVCHKPGGRLPLLSARPAVTPATLKTAASATNFAVMAQNEQTTEEHSTLEQQSPGRLDHSAWCVVWTV